MLSLASSGKTEIARRLAKLSDAPFIKVEATKFTEVGYHGRDVDTIIKDLVRETGSPILGPEVLTSLPDHAFRYFR